MTAPAERGDVSGQGDGGRGGQQRSDSGGLSDAAANVMRSARLGNQVGRPALSNQSNAGTQSIT